MLKCPLLVIFFLLPAALFPQVKKPITHEDMWLMKG
jgi:hypothetical protein